MHPKTVPHLIYSDPQGKIYDIPELEASGRSGKETLRLKPEDFILMPEGTELFRLPGRTPMGFDRKTGEKLAFHEGEAMAAFIAPAHTQLYLAAYESGAKAPRLPLYAYTAVGWLDDRFYVTARRIDPDIRQDCQYFNQNQVLKGVKALLKKYPKNRLLHHIGENCATKYLCPAARNFFLNRWEAPLPTSPACNCRCVGCISWQPAETGVPAPQDRIAFIPTVEEITEVAVMHLETAPRPVVSFGQGCEGEPLMVWETLRDSIKAIRKKTSKGIINLNTNGSRPEAVRELFKAGLDSIRVSLNSARKELYTAYYRPQNYTFEEVLESVGMASAFGRWSSLNYFVYPGVTDQHEEWEALKKLIEKTGLSMIQWRNFNIDPDWYEETIGTPEGTASGMKDHLDRVRKAFPGLYFGYYNPYGDVMEAHRKAFQI